MIDDDPGGITKPNTPCMLDLFLEKWELAFAFAHIVITGGEALCHLLAGAGGDFQGVESVRHRYRRPKQQNNTIRDQWNAVGPGISAAVRSCLILMHYPIRG